MTQMSTQERFERLEEALAVVALHPALYGLAWRGMPDHVRAPLVGLLDDVRARKQEDQ